MKTITVISSTALMLLLSIRCSRGPVNFFQPGNQDKLIAIQPLYFQDTGKLNFIRGEIEKFYNVKVVVLPSIPIPEKFRPPLTYAYSADSLLNLLSTKVNREHIEVIGIASPGIFISEPGPPQSPYPFSYSPLRKIFGLADVGGNCAVISTANFHSEDSSIFQHRFRTAVIHELGHNIGLDHCLTDYCIMSEKNGTLAGLDKSNKDYCVNCRKTLEEINPYYPWQQ